jgi:isochorismate synthase
VISVLHPTPVCGLPKQEAKDFILKNEGYDREYYTGFWR